MIFTTEMIHLTAIVLKERSDDVTKAFLDLGAVQFTRLREMGGPTDERLRQSSVHERGAQLTETRRRIETMLSMANIGLPVVAEMQKSDAEVDTSKIHGRIDRLTKEMEGHRSRQADIQRQINRLSDVRRQLAELGTGDNSLTQSLAFASKTSAGSRFLDIRYGRVSAARVSSLDHEVGRVSGIVVPVGSAGSEQPVLVISMKRNAGEVKSILSDHAFSAAEIPDLGEENGTNPLVEAEGRIARLESEQREEELKARAVVEDHRDELEEAWREVRVEELCLSIKGETSESSHAAIFAGWLPRRRRRLVEEAISRSTDGGCFLEWHDAKELARSSGGTVKVPVELSNPRFLKPFQMLVTNFGIPEYGTIDPTPIVAIAYLLMFGLMFGDAGHGLVLVLLGIIGQRVFPTPGYRQLSRLVVWCGGASILMGILFGAYFGYELLPPLWFDYHRVVAGHADAGSVESIMDILTITIYFGIAVIGIGLLLNWINCIRKRHWIELLFEKTGILGGLIYATGIWVAASFATSGFRELPDLRIAGFLIVVPSVLLFLKFPLEAARHKNVGARPSVGMWIMNWIIELLEVFAGYLANTLSFMRVAGLGIAHVMLMVAFFQIAEMVSPGGVSILSIVVLVFGNVLVIALEGLSAGIQSLRLNYYEFFSKYFVPTGLAFHPVALDNTTQGD